MTRKRAPSPTHDAGVQTSVHSLRLFALISALAVLNSNLVRGCLRHAGEQVR